jgi:hypothetical protein
MFADIATASASDDLAGIAHRPKITTTATIRNEHSGRNSGHHSPILKTEEKKQVAPDRRDWESVLILDIIELDIIELCGVKSSALEPLPLV